jgi:hypothetical protein
MWRGTHVIASKILFDLLARYYGFIRQLARKCSYFKYFRDYVQRIRAGYPWPDFGWVRLNYLSSSFVLSFSPGHKEVRISAWRDPDKWLKLDTPTCTTISFDLDGRGI